MSNVRLNWKLPTKRVGSNAAINPSEVSGTRIYLSADGGQNFAELAVVPAPTTTFLQTELEPGTYVFRLVALDARNAARNSAPVDGSATIETTAALDVITDLVITVE